MRHVAALDAACPGLRLRKTLVLSASAPEVEAKGISTSRTLRSPKSGQRGSGFRIPEAQCSGAARAPAHLCETMGDEEVASLHSGRKRTRAAGHAHCAPLSGAAAELRLETVREAVVDMKRRMPANAREEG